jgi:hypothetical protein
MIVSFIETDQQQRLLLERHWHPSKKEHKRSQTLTIIIKCHLLNIPALLQCTRYNHLSRGVIWSADLKELVNCIHTLDLTGCIEGYIRKTQEILIYLS